MKRFLIICLFLLTVQVGHTQSSSEKQVGGTCETCELMVEGMPTTLHWKTTIASSSEAGEPLLISGIIYKKDGKTPAPGIILYIYHTDAKGLYSASPNQQYGKQHGHLRGWMKTDAQGRYEFKTIRPASYPNSKNPQHIHPIIKEPGVSFYWIDDFVFDDDPLLSEQEKTKLPNRGGSGLLVLKKNEKGIWTGQRDIVLGLNIPNY